MTLITYPTRVHFAAGILEEALHAELESQDYDRPLILCEQEDADGEFAARVNSGLPRRTRATHITIGSRDSKYDTGRKTQMSARKGLPDVILAFGSSRAIGHARKCRHVLHQEILDRSGELDPIPLFAVPGIDGLPNPCRSTLTDTSLVDAASRSGLPNMIICDPTVAEDATETEAASATADAIARCIEAYLSKSYNPPANGMAIDGLLRAAGSLRGACDARDRRELMAASLNASLSQQKGLGMTQLLADILREPHGNRLMSGALARVLLPAVLDGKKVSDDQRRPIDQILGLSSEVHLWQEIEALFEQLPLADRLSDLGLTRDDISQAKDEMRQPLALNSQVPPDGAMSILEAVF